jgi:hypothetical protein
LSIIEEMLSTNNQLIMCQHSSQTAQDDAVGISRGLHNEVPLGKRRQASEQGVAGASGGKRQSIVGYSLRHLGHIRSLKNTFKNFPPLLCDTTRKDEMMM